MDVSAREVAENYLRYDDPDEITLAKAYLNLLASMEGKVLVPEEPTEEMLESGYIEWVMVHPAADIRAGLRNAYKAMLDKAKEVPWT